MTASFGSILTTARRKAGYTQLEIAKLIGHDSRYRLSRWEVDTAFPHRSAMADLQEVLSLGMDLDDLMALRPLRKGARRKTGQRLEEPAPRADKDYIQRETHRDYGDEGVEMSRPHYPRCKGSRCPKKDLCVRHTAKAEGQPWFKKTPYIPHEGCLYFWNNRKG